MWWIFMVVQTSAGAWLLHILVVVLCLLPDIIIGMLESHYVRNGGFSWYENEISSIRKTIRTLIFKNH